MTLVHFPNFAVCFYKTRVVSHYDLAIYIKKLYWGKKKLRKLNYFTMQKYNLPQKKKKKKKNIIITLL